MTSNLPLHYHRLIVAKKQIIRWRCVAAISRWCDLEREESLWHGIVAFKDRLSTCSQTSLALMYYLRVSFTLSKPQSSNRMHSTHLISLTNTYLYQSMFSFWAFTTPIIREQDCAACYDHWAATIHLAIMGWHETCWLNPVWNHVSGSLRDFYKQTKPQERYVICFKKRLFIGIHD